MRRQELQKQPRINTNEHQFPASSFLITHYSENQPSLCYGSADEDEDENENGAEAEDENGDESERGLHLLSAFRYSALSHLDELEALSLPKSS